MRAVFAYRRILILVVVLTIGSGAAFSQKTAAYTHSNASLETAMELFQKQKYGAAQKTFNEVIALNPQPNSLVRIDAEYYAALCAMELFNKDAELLLRNFILAHPESNKAKWAYFQLGKYNFRKKDYKDATHWFELVDPYNLNIEERPEYYFKRGYSYFELEQTERAKKDFYEIKDVDTRYSGAANYYYSHLAYNEKNYQTALEGFLRLRQNETFGPVVPYYIAQLYYLQTKYDSVIAFATPMLDSASTKRAPEIARIIGESYYRTNKYSEAIPFLLKYEKSNARLSRDDKYEMGYAFYKTGKYEDAINYFIYASEYEDSTAQNAHYHLADCYIKKNNKQAARAAFRAASKMDYDAHIKEDALFSYARLCYELSFNPYSEAIEAFRQYIAEYPNTSRTDEAYAFLLNAYLSSKSYSAALASIESIKNLSDQLKAAYQKIAYNHAVELYNNLATDTAIAYFNKALKYKFDKSISALCHYWKAESYYRKKNYDLAIDNYKEFMGEPGAINTREFDLINYNTGYCYFQQKDYATSTLWFRKFVNENPKDLRDKVTDALIRIGDGYFISKDYSNAIEFYGDAIKEKKTDVDYAMYQQAMAFGVLKKAEAKVKDLELLLSNYPSSNYAAAAKFELANTLFNDGQYDKALAYYQKVLAEHSRTNYVTRCMLKVGLVYYNKKQDDLALESLKKLVSTHPHTYEAQEAIQTIQRIYVGKSNVAEFEKWLAGVPDANISKSSLDSSNYEVAKNKYFENDCEQAVKAFDAYLQRYPDGIFTLESNYYKGECLYRGQHFKEALDAYAYVIDKPKSAFTEQALVHSSIMNYSAKNYTAANANYVALENNAEKPENIRLSRIGQMRCNFIFKNYEAATRSAKAVLSTEKISADIIAEAHLIVAKSAFETENYDLALAEFKQCVELSKNESAAESKYNIAYIQHLKADYIESKKTLFELIKQLASYKQWLTKGMILLADNYLALNDKFQAKTALKSVIEDSDIPELVALAQSKLNAIIESEKPAVQTLPNDQLQLDMNKSKEELELFKEEPKKGGQQQ